MNPRKPLLRLAVFALIAGILWPSPSWSYNMLYLTGLARGSNVSCTNKNGFAHWPWNQGTIYWYHNNSGAGALKALPIRNALATWTNAAESDHVLTYAGTTTAGLNISDNQNTMVWGSTTDPSLCGTMACHAVTTVRYSSQQVLYEVDLVFNDQMDWRTDGTYDSTCASSVTNPDGTPRLGVAIDTQAVVTHELGHSLGLGHSSDSAATMGGSPCTLDGRSPNADDLAGLQCSTNRYPLNPSYEGYFDGYAGLSCNQISGWAWNARRGNDPVYVNIWDGSALTAVVLANQYRSDLVSAGKGNGYHGFIYTVPSSMKNGQWHTISARFSGGTEGDLMWSPRRLICRASIFTTQTPTEFTDNAGQPYSVGNIFSSSEDGVITHLKYYKASEEAGYHTLKLWTLSGQFLASGTAYFYAGPQQWVTADIPDTPITKNTQYMVTVTTYTKTSKTPCGLGTPISNGPLTATGGGWGAGDGIFPNTGSCSNFWTDVIFNM